MKFNTIIKPFKIIEQSQFLGHFAAKLELVKASHV